MGAEFKFRAADAMVYVDTYRRQILHPAPRVQTDLHRIKEQMLDPNSKLSPTRQYAELRALEHALAFVTKREEPGLVLLGEGEPGEEAAVATSAGVKSAKQLAQDLRRCEEHGETLETSLKQSKLREHELQEELVSREQHIARLNHRLSNSQSTITVLSATLALTFFILVFVMFF